MGYPFFLLFIHCIVFLFTSEMQTGGQMTASFLASILFEACTMILFC